MIALSRFRPAAGLFAVALLVISSLSVGCWGGHACNTIGCYSELTIQFHGGNFVDGGAPGDGGAPAETLDINIETQEGQNFVPLMTCSFATGISNSGGHELRCSSSRTHREDFEGTHIEDTSLKTVRVTVSAAGNQISQETFALSWTSREVWGSGCGYCTQATVMVRLPGSGV